MEDGYIFFSFDVVINESNRVGGIVSTAKAEAFLGDTLMATEIKREETFSAYGSITFSFKLQIFGSTIPDVLIDLVTVEVKGVDANGYPFTKNYATGVAWNKTSAFSVR